MKILAVKVFNSYVEILVQFENTVNRFSNTNYKLAVEDAREHYGIC